MINLKEQYGKRYRVTMDESWDAEKPEYRKLEDKFWYYEIWGKRGWCYNQNLTTLALELNNRIFNAFKDTMPFPCDHVRVGDETQKLIVSEEHAEKAISFLIPRKRRQLTEEQKAAFSERIKSYRFLPRQKTV